MASRWAGPAPDAGADCFVPTLMGMSMPPGEKVASGSVVLHIAPSDDKEDALLLTSVQVHPSPGCRLAQLCEGLRLSVPSESAGLRRVLANGGAASEDGLVLSLASVGEDLRALADGSGLAVRLEVTGEAPAEPWSVTLDVCVKPGPHRVIAL